LDTQAPPGPRDCREAVPGGAETKTFNTGLLVVGFTLLQG